MEILSSNTLRQWSETHQNPTSAINKLTFWKKDCKKLVTVQFTETNLKNYNQSILNGFLNTLHEAVHRAPCRAKYSTNKPIV